MWSLVLNLWLFVTKIRRRVDPCVYESRPLTRVHALCEASRPGVMTGVEFVADSRFRLKRDEKELETAHVTGKHFYSIPPVREGGVFAQCTAEVADLCPERLCLCVCLQGEHAERAQLRWRHRRLPCRHCQAGLYHTIPSIPHPKPKTQLNHTLDVATCWSSKQIECHAIVNRTMNRTMPSTPHTYLILNPTPETSH